MTEKTYTTVRKRRERGPVTEARITKLAKGLAARVTNQNQAVEEATMWGGAGIDIIEPPYDLSLLASLPEDSDELGQCIDAIVTGVTGFGSRPVHDFELVEGSVPEDIKADVKREEAEILNFMEQCGTDDDYDALRLKCITDLVTVGNAYFEIVRGPDGRPQSLEHVVAAQVRHGALDDDFTLVNTPIRKRDAEGRSILTMRREYKRFRRYCQLSEVSFYGSISSKSTISRTWFKSLGDPRDFDNQTGELLGEMVGGKYQPDAEKVEKARVEHRLANELVHFTEYNVTGSSYGKPKYIGNLFSIYGARLAEKLNYNTFRSNNVPSMVVTVSGGQLTEKSVTRMEDFVNSHIEGDQNMSKFLLLEGESFFENDEAGPAVKVDVKPLTAVQRSDGMFVQYHEDCRGSIRGSFRLPPLMVGRSTEWTGAVINGARKLADETIYAPIRERWDRFFNRKVAPLLGWRWHRLESNSPNTTDNVELVTLVGTAEKSGAVTPRIARVVLEKVLGCKLPPFPEGFDADIPFSQTMAEAVKNKADPTEPGQQVTALKG